MEPQTASSDAMISALFQRLHGYFGNSFLDKFRTGQARADGLDAGVENAKRIWARELAGTPGEVIGAALRALRDRGAPFPPSLPEFAALCRASRPPVPRERSLTAPAATARSAESKAEFAVAMAQLRPAEGGIGGLLANVAKAIALAGGDEVSALRRLESNVVRT